ncbi:hypothetical protein A4R26_22385 [Niastella populi]|uniref:Uncharacterized protein n=1 Tax=Niastella populi TaxID=550983 RepID=A0A1V9FKS8_9BACT|nr:hypothetical protein A4R26_22385 [Niastella populi]
METILPYAFVSYENHRTLCARLPLKNCRTLCACLSRKQAGIYRSLSRWYRRGFPACSKGKPYQSQLCAQELRPVSGADAVMAAG